MTSRRGGQRGNLNAIKHGLYSQYIPEIDRRELRKMPAESVLMELVAARSLVAQAMQIARDMSTEDAEKKLAGLLAVLGGLEAVARLVTKEQFLNGDAPILQSLWDVIRDVNEAEGVSSDV